MINKSFWKNKKVLITGHTGFMGSWLTLWLHKLEAEICGYSKDIPTSPSLFETAKLSKYLKKDVRADLRENKKLKKVINNFKPQIIFHLAAQSSVLESYENSIDTITSNIIGTANLIESVKNLESLKSVIIVSTDKVYKNLEKNNIFIEGDPLGGDDIYSSSKACADLITQSYYNSFFIEKKIGFGIVRAGNIIGGGDWKPFRLVPDCLKALSKNERVYLRNPGSVRPWQHVLEPLSGYIILAEKIYNGKKINSVIWNFGPSNSNCVSVKEMFLLLSKKYGNNSSYIISKKKYFPENKLLRINSKMSKKYLGWKQKLSLKKTIEFSVDWHKSWRKKDNMFDLCFKQISEYEKYK